MKPLTEEQKAEALRLYATGMSIKKVAEKMSIAHQRVCDALSEEGVVRTPTAIHTPTPEEISRVTEEMQKSWSRKEERAHRVMKPRHVHPILCENLSHRVIHQEVD